MTSAGTKTILIVDDDRSVLRGLEKRLVSEGYRVVAATNGEDALTCARKQSPDAVLLDVGLPGELDGLKVAFRLHEDPQTAHVPIIFVTGAAGDDFKNDCRFVRAKYFVSKPYDPDVLVGLLRGVFATDELGEMRRISAAKRRQPVAATPRTPDGPRGPYPPVA